LVWLNFAIALVIILFAGTRLARYGDAIAEKTGLGRLWIGLILLAAITSVPELATGISAVALVGDPNLAVGALFGSNIFNLAILALIDTVHPYTPLLSLISSRQMLVAVGGILLITVAGLGILAGEFFSPLTLGWLGMSSIVIILLYLWLVRTMFRREQHEQNEQPSDTEPEPTLYHEMSHRSVWLKFALASAAVIGAGIWVSFLGDEIATVTGWDTSFVGSLFLAVSTSMPELVVTFAALRLGAYDLAVADILGSNMFNMAIILPIDIFYTQQAVLSAASSVHLITAAVGIVMTLVIIVGMRLKQKRKTFKLFSWYAAVLFGLYLAGFYTLFRAGLG
jgi:cation:H+ antiporter